MPFAPALPCGGNRLASMLEGQRVVALSPR